MVQDIRIGELLMGDDSTPRRVNNLVTGNDTLYEIDCQNGDKFTVNKDHILCLKYSKNKHIYFSKSKCAYIVAWFDKSIKSKTFSNKQEAEKYIQDINENQYLEISVKNYLKLSNKLQSNFKCYMTGVDFNEKYIELDPYMLGIWLANNKNTDKYTDKYIGNSIEVNTTNSKILKYFRDNLYKYNCYFDYKDDCGYTIRSCENRNQFLEKLMKYDLKHIPFNYKCNSRSIRLSLLSGLIDSYGKYKNGNYILIQTNKTLTEDISYLCRSLGFYSCIKENLCKKTNDIYYCVYVSGDKLNDIPILSSSKQYKKYVYSRNLELISFKINEVGLGDYYGFTVDKNSKYLMGNFIVTHNSLVAALLFAELKMRHYKAEYVQEYAKTLVWQGRFDDLANQYNVSLEQYRMIKAVSGKVEFICLDSPLLIGLYYNRHHPTNVCNIEKTEFMIRSKMEEFDNIYIFLERNEEYPFETEGRIHSEEQSKNIDKQFLELLDELNIKYKTFKSDKRNIDAILEYVISS